MVSTSYQGPLAPPSILRQYNEICPGCAERRVSAFEAEGNHRRALELKAVDANIEGMRRQFTEARIGQIFAFILSLAFLFTGAYTAIRGQSWVGGVLGSMGIATIVGMFIRGRTRKREPNPEEKTDQKVSKQAKKKNR